MSQLLALLGALLFVVGGASLGVLLQDLWPLPSDRSDILETLRFAAPLVAAWAAAVAMLFAMASYAKPSTRMVFPPMPERQEQSEPPAEPGRFSIPSPSAQPQVVVVRRGSGGNVLAALLTFLLPGLGHLCQGRVISAIGLLGALLVVAFIGLAAASPLVLFVGVPVVYLAAIVDCAQWDPDAAKSTLDRL